MVLPKRLLAAGLLTLIAALAAPAFPLVAKQANLSLEIDGIVCDIDAIYEAAPDPTQVVIPDYCSNKPEPEVPTEDPDGSGTGTPDPTLTPVLGETVFIPPSSILFGRPLAEPEDFIVAPVPPSISVRPPVDMGNEWSESGEVAVPGAQTPARGQRDFVVEVAQSVVIISVSIGILLLVRRSVPPPKK